MSFKDRKEGRYIKTLIPYIKIMSYVMPSRNDSMNMFEDSIEVTAASKYVNEKRKEGLRNFGLMHVLIASYVRAISQVPSLNRFTNGKRVYSRNNIEYVMTVKKEMRADATETSIKVIFEPTDTATDVYNKMEAAVSGVKATTKATARTRPPPRL